MHALQAPAVRAAAAPGVARNRTVRGVALPARIKQAPTASQLARSQSRCAAAAVEAPTASPPSPAPPAGSSSSSGSPAPAAATASPPELFDWARSWYPIAALSGLKPDAPNAVQLLGQRLVVWKDKQGDWRAFADVCPHRLVPLSEGRIHESGELQCTYHGWRFDSSGSCTSIPQIPEPKAHSTACSSNRACVKAFPTQVLQDMLWVFGDSSPDAWLAAAAAPLPSSAAEELLQAGWTLKSPWFQRDIPLSFDILLENMNDPSHVPQSHSGVVVSVSAQQQQQQQQPELLLLLLRLTPDHAAAWTSGKRHVGAAAAFCFLQGDRNSDQRMSITADTPITAAGYTVGVQPPAASGFTGYNIQYKAPCLVRYNFPGDVTMLLYGLPTAAGWSRVIMGFASPPQGGRSRPATPQLPWLLNAFIDNVIEKSPALTHALNRNPIIDGDTYFMHVGEREFYGRGGGHSDWGRQYYMPATADAAVLAWRRWIDRHGSGLPVLPKSAADLPPLMPREAVFDRYNQHTKHCPHCSSALRNATIAAGLLAAVAAVAVGSIVAAVVGGAPLLSGFTAASAAVAAVASGLVAAMLQLRQLFIYTDYVHAEH